MGDSVKERTPEWYTMDRIVDELVERGWIDVGDEGEVFTETVGIARLAAPLVEANAKIAALSAECERLRAVVGRLPLTADGVPVTPGMMLYVDTDDLPESMNDMRGCGIVEAAALWDDDNGFDMGDDIGTLNYAACWRRDTSDCIFWGHVQVEDAFSTRAAALAAAPAEGGGA